MQLAQGLHRKNKPCRKKKKKRKKTMKKKEKCAVIFKKPVSYCRFVSALERPMLTEACMLVVVSLGLRLCKGVKGRPGVSFSSSLITWSVHTAMCCIRLRGAVWNPVLAPPKLTDHQGKVGS